MGIIIFWSALAFGYFILALVTGRALYKIKQDLNKLDKISPSGFIKNGKTIGVESTLYNAIKAILITDIIAFVLAAVAAIVSSIITT